MSILANLSTRKERKEEQVKESIQDFMTLIRVYYQSAMAINLGITNIRMLPDLTMYKHIFKIPTQGGKLGVGEKAHTRKTLMQNYNISENFFKELDASIKKNCRTQNDVNPYLYTFQDFSNTLFMLVGTLMKWKFGLPKMFSKMLYKMTLKTVHDIMTKSSWKADGVTENAQKIRVYKEKLGLSEEWMAEYIFKIIMVTKMKTRKMDSI